MTPAPATGRTAEDALVDRLRSWGENDPDEAYFQGDALACLLIDCGKASEAIANLRADLRESAMQHIARDLGDEQAWTEIATLRARLQEAERALKTFAVAADVREPINKDRADNIACFSGLCAPLVGDFRRARAALASTSNIPVTQPVS